jgi:hypothetical protein
MVQLIDRRCMMTVDTRPTFGTQRIEGLLTFSYLCEITMPPEAVD